MSAGGAFGGARGYQPRPPEKGVFPLDHFGECKQIKEEYLVCLKQHSSDAEACRELAKTYLKCRMERNLMAKQDLKDLGFAEGDGPAPAPAPKEQQPTSDKRRIETEGYLAGMRRFEKDV
ncbi:Cytochrome c oxidase assembly protein COX19 [Chlorella vulgaris]